MIGCRFGRLLVIGDGEKYTKPDGRSEKRYKCLCDCGSKKDVLSYCLKSGMTKSCGCLQKERAGNANRKHGMSNSKEFSVWTNMITRCTNKNNHAYKHYGGRGITVSDEWMSFEVFFKDMGFCPEGLTLERVNNDEGYSKYNCKWATMKEQCENRRLPLDTSNFAKKLTKHDVIEIRKLRRSGETLKAIAARFGIAHSYVSRIMNGTVWNRVKDESH